jgi:hypothetical protein
MVILETSVFTRAITEIMSDDDYAQLQAARATNPEYGDVIARSGGIRKARWRASGRGKRGGARIIYYWYVAGDQIFMLLAYTKSARDDLTRAQLKQLRALVEQEFGDG